MRLAGLTQWAATAVYDSSGAAKKVDGTLDSLNEQYDEKRELASSPIVGDVIESTTMVGSSDGP